MASLFKMWEQIDSDPNTKERAYGKQLVASYSANDLFSSPELEWFRAAVRDVRSSMNLYPGELMIQRLILYEEMGMELPQGSATTEIVRSFKRHFLGPFRPRRGFVIYGECPTLFLSQHGIKTPRVVYEEVAHSLFRELPVDSSDRQPHDHNIEKYIERLMRQPMHFPRQRIHWPVECHLDIYRGFLNGSEAYRQSVESDRQFVRNLVHRLEFVHQCRRLKPLVRSQCPCPTFPQPT